MQHTQSEPPIGILQEILDLLPNATRHHILFSWGKRFQEQPSDYQDPLLVHLFSTISSINITFDQQFDLEEFVSLQHLPLTNFQHLLISNCKLKQTSDHSHHHNHSPSKPRDHCCSKGKTNFNAVLEAIGMCSIFNNLRTLKLIKSNVVSLKPLVSGKNKFLHMEKLFLCGPDAFPSMRQAYFSPTCFPVDVSALFTSPDLFPALQVLHLPGFRFDPNIFKSIPESGLSTFRLNELYMPADCSDPVLVEALVASPLCSQLRFLTLPFGTASVISYFVNNPERFSNLESLEVVDGCEPLDSTAQAWVRFFQSPVSHSLTTLKIESDCNISVFKAPGTSTYLEKLKSLSICGTREENRSSHLRLLLDNFQPKLKTFRISDVCIVPDVIDLIATAPCLSELEVLELRELPVLEGLEDYFSDPLPFAQVITKLIQSPGVLSKLTSLKLEDADISEGPIGEVVTALLTSPNLSNSLTELSLPGLSMDSSHAHILTHQLANPDDPTQGLKFGKLNKLTLNDSHIGVDVVESLSQLTSLTHLNLTHCSSGDQGLLALIALDPELSTPSCPIPLLPNLVELNLSSNDITDNGFKALAKSHFLEQLKSLKIGMNQPTSSGAVALGTAPQAAKLTSFEMFSMSRSLLTKEEQDLIHSSKRFCEVSLIR